MFALFSVNPFRKHPAQLLSLWILLVLFYFSLLFRYQGKMYSLIRLMGMYWINNILVGENASSVHCEWYENIFNMPENCLFNTNFFVNANLVRSTNMSQSTSSRAHTHTHSSVPYKHSLCVKCMEMKLIAIQLFPVFNGDQMCKIELCAGKGTNGN